MYTKILAIIVCALVPGAYAPSGEPYIGPCGKLGDSCGKTQWPYPKDDSCCQGSCVSGVCSQVDLGERCRGRKFECKGGYCDNNICNKWKADGEECWAKYECSSLVCRPVSASRWECGNRPAHSKQPQPTPCDGATCCKGEGCAECCGDQECVRASSLSKRHHCERRGSGTKHPDDCEDSDDCDDGMKCEDGMCTIPFTHCTNSDICPSGKECKKGICQYKNVQKKCFEEGKYCNDDVLSPYHGPEFRCCPGLKCTTKIDGDTACKIE